ncbi:MAG: MATE family efflux transporter [Oligoflexales bacterium]|nr:MATE family efflux transporter [Oligoflexales bacterium]
MDTTTTSHQISYRNLFLTSIPAVAAVGLEPMAEIIDTALLGQFNSQWVAAVAATNTFIASFTWVFNFLSYSVTAQIGQNLGSKNKGALLGLVKLSILLSLGIGISVSLILLFGKNFFLETVLGASDQLSMASNSYWNIRIIGYSLSLLSLALMGILRGLQQFKLCFLVILLITSTNAIGSYASLYWFSFGIRGVAWSTVLAFALGDGLSLYWIVSKQSLFRWSWKGRIPIAYVKAFSKDSINLFGRSACLTASLFLMSAMATRLGSLSLAAHQIVLQLWLFTSFFTDGLAVTAASIGSKLVGEKNLRLHKFMSNRLLVGGVICGFFFSLVYGFGRGFIVPLFTQDQQLVKLLEEFWIILVLSQPINGLVYVYDGILFGTRDYGLLRKRMIEGLFLVFLPAMTIVMLLLNNLFGIWLSMSLLAGYRAITAAVFHHFSHHSIYYRLKSC